MAFGAAASAARPSIIRVETPLTAGRLEPMALCLLCPTVSSGCRGSRAGPGAFGASPRHKPLRLFGHRREDLSRTVFRPKSLPIETRRNRQQPGAEVPRRLGFETAAKPVRGAQEGPAVLRQQINCRSDTGRSCRNRQSCQACRRAVPCRWIRECHFAAGICPRSSSAHAGRHWSGRANSHRSPDWSRPGWIAVAAVHQEGSRSLCLQRYAGPLRGGRARGRDEEIGEDHQNSKSPHVKPRS